MFYMHFKGKFYLKIFEARCCNDCTKVFTVYASLYTNDFKFGQLWIMRSNVFDDIHPKANTKRMRKLTLTEIIMLLTGFKKRIKQTQET